MSRPAYDLDKRLNEILAGPEGVVEYDKLRDPSVQNRVEETYREAFTQLYKGE